MLKDMTNRELLKEYLRTHIDLDRYLEESNYKKYNIERDRLILIIDEMHRRNIYFKYIDFMNSLDEKDDEQ